MSEVSREDWEAGWVQAYIWQCGDDECDCHEPMIEQVEPNRRVGYPWVRRRVLWSGTRVPMAYRDDDDPTYEDLLAELAEAKKKFPDARWLPAEEEV